MTKTDWPTMPPMPPRGPDGGPRRSDAPQPPSRMRVLLGLLLAIVVVYGGYFWFVRRVVVSRDHVMVVMKKNGNVKLNGIDDV